MERISTQEDFVFGSVMSNKHLCQHLIQIILPELRINRIEFPTLQKAVQENIISRGVRFDVYTKDQNGVVYEIDMQVRHTRGLPQWVRYYQGRIDGDMLRHGQPYAKLRQSYVIFICPFHPYDKGLHKYEFRNYCRQDKSLAMGDGRTAIFLNAKGMVNDVDQDLRNFLEYVDNKDVKDDHYVDELRDYINVLSKDTEWRKEYMDNKTHMMFHDEDIRAEGRKEGRAEGQTLAIKKTVAMLKPMDIPETEIAKKIQQTFDLSDQEAADMINTK